MNDMLSGGPAPSGRSALEQMDETNHPVEASDGDDEAVTVTRSAKEWKRQVAGHLLKSIGDADFTLSAALNGSKWRVILYRLFGMRAGKQVFMDRDVVIMGARAPIHNVPAQQVAALPNSLVPPAALAR